MLWQAQNRRPSSEIFRICSEFVTNGNTSDSIHPDDPEVHPLVLHHPFARPSCRPRCWESSCVLLYPAPSRSCMGAIAYTATEPQAARDQFPGKIAPVCIKVAARKVAFVFRSRFIPTACSIVVMCAGVSHTIGRDSCAAKIYCPVRKSQTAKSSFQASQTGHATRLHPA